MVTGNVVATAETADSSEFAPDSSRALIRAVVVLGVVGGVVLRVLIAFSSLNELDSDEAIVGLMAQDFVDGDPAIFYWGQAYGGSIESAVLAPFTAIFGTHALVLRAVGVLWTGAIAVTTWRVGLRLLPRAQAAVAAAMLFLVWPLFGVYWAMKLRGFYLSLALLGMLVFLLVLRLDQNRTRRDAGLLGVVIGLGFWQGALIVFFALPAAVYVVWSNRDALRLWWVTLIGFVAGSFPWWLANVRTQWASLDLPEGTSATVGDRLWGLVVEVLPQALGLKHWAVFCDFAADCSVFKGWIIPVVAPLLYLAALAGIGYFALRRPPGSRLLLLTLAFMPLVYLVSPFTWHAGTPRYLMALFPVFALVAAFAFTRDSIALGAVGAGLALSIVGLFTFPGLDFGAAQLTRSSDAALIDALEERGVERMYANYWLAYRISYQSDRSVVAVGFDTNRGGSLQEELDSPGAPPAYIFEASDAVFACRFQAVLDDRGIGYSHDVVRGRDLYVPDERVDRSDVPEVWDLNADVGADCVTPR